MPADTFGGLLRRCWAAGAAAGAVTEEIERDDGVISRGDVARYFDGPDPREESLLQAARGRILDIGCGAGRHLAALAASRADVSGIDPSPGAVAVCRDRGLAAEVGDIDRLPAGPFGTLLLMGGNLALLGSPESARLRLAGMAAVAAPGALLLGSNLDPHQGADPGHAEYHRRNRERGRPGGQLRLRVRDGATAGAWLDYWLFSTAELADLVADSPWRLEHVDGGGPGDPFYTAVLALR